MLIVLVSTVILQRIQMLENFRVLRKLGKGNIEWFVCTSFWMQVATCIIRNLHPKRLVSIDGLLNADVPIVGKWCLVHFLKQLLSPQV